MSEVAEKAEKPDYKFRLSENYAIDTDPRNIILLEKYEKRDGKGKFAPLSGKFGWKQIGYFQKFDRVASTLVDLEIGKSDSVDNLMELAERVKTLKKEMAEFLTDKIVLKIE